MHRSRLALLVLAVTGLVALLPIALSRISAQEGAYSGPTAEATATPTATVIPIVEIVVETESEVTVVVSTTETVEVSTTTADGSEAGVAVPPGALPEGATVEVSVIVDIASVIAQAPAATLADVDLIVSFQFTATSEDGAPIEQFEQPVQIELTLESTSIPADADLEDLAVAFWNGTRWVVLQTTATLNADGSLKLSTTADHFTVFVILQLRPTVFDIPPAGMLAQGLAGTNDPLRLVAVQKSAVESMFKFEAGDWFVHIPGAPAIVNDLTSLNLTPDTAVIIRFLNTSFSVAIEAR